MHQRVLRIAFLGVVAALLVACGPEAEAPPPSATVDVHFPQARAGALLVSPTRNTSFDLRIAGVPEADSLTLSLDGEGVEVIWSQEHGLYLASLELAGRSGNLSLEGRSTGLTGEGRAELSLVLSDAGAQITQHAIVGTASSPDLHDDGQRLWLTWVDEREDGLGRLYRQEIDGAGQLRGEAVAMSPDGLDLRSAEVLYADGFWALLYRREDPLGNELMLLGAEGEVLAGPIALQEDSEIGSFGGALAYDGSGFVVVARGFDEASETSVVRWLRLPIDGGDPVGPLAISDGGDAALGEHFLPYTPFGIGAEDDRTLVTFVRQDWNSLFEMILPIAHRLVLDENGQVLEDEALPIPLSYPMAGEARVSRIGDRFLPLWSGISLLDEDLNPPYRVFAASLTRFDLESEEAYSAIELFSAPHLRSEFLAVPHNEEGSVLLWSDERLHVETPDEGKIQLYAASLSDELALGDPQLIGHSLVFASSSQVQGKGRANGVQVVWIDERNGLSEGVPTPELFFDSLWF